MLRSSSRPKYCHPQISIHDLQVPECLGEVPDRLSKQKLDSLLCEYVCANNDNMVEVDEIRSFLSLHKIKCSEVHLYL